MKRAFSFLLALCLLLGCLPMSASAAGVTVKEVVPCQYDTVHSFSEGLAAVELDEKWGFIDKTGKKVVPCKYDYADSFSEGLAEVCVGEYPDAKWGYIDKTGKEIVPCKYDSVNGFSEGLARVVVYNNGDSKYGFVDKTGKEVVPCKYGGAEDFSEGFALVEVGVHNSGDTKYGYIDKTGKEVIPCKYNDAGSFSEGLAAVTLNDKWGVIDKTGKEVVLCQYDNVNSFSEGFAAVRLNDKIGFIDKTGKEVVPLQYEGVSGFSEGLAAVKLDGKWGFISLERETVAGFQDVSPDDYYANAVVWAVANRITAGTSDSTFSPNDTCSRAQIVSFLWRAAGRPEPTNTSISFTDVEPGAYYEKAVQWAVENRITAGTSDSTFSPNDTCTRGQIVSFLWRAHGRLDPTNTSTSFRDVEAGAYYEKAAQWAVENRITAGTSDTTFSPNDTCVRAQGVAFLWRAAGRPE